MSNLQAAISQAELRAPITGVPLKTRTKLQVAKRIFTLAAAGGFPYTGQTYKDWAKKWLTSDTYRLMEIDINAAASPHLPKNPERVAYRLLCDTDSMDPIVVDLNKQKTGQSHLGYIPKVVVLDGKHRKQAQMLQGHNRILAWVGCRAEKHLKNTRVIDRLDFSKVRAPNVGKGITIQAARMHNVDRVQFKQSPIETSFNLHCATQPAVGQALVDQSGGEAGSRPRTSMVKGGGPGSGRHPGEVAMNHGFKVNRSQSIPNGPTVYTKGSHAVSVDGNQWSHINDATDMHQTNGNGGSSLDKHLSKVLSAAGSGGASGGMGGPGASLGSGSGSNPLTMRGKKVNARDCNACGTAPYSMGQLEEPSASDDPGQVPSPSDQTSRVSPSDQRKYEFPKPNINAPGNNGWETEPGTLVGSNLAPFLTKSTGASRSEMSKKFRSFKQGTGTGPTLGKNTGASRSEMSRLANTVPGVGTRSVQGKGKMVRRIYTKAPPGFSEKTMHQLKRKHGTTNAFKVAWSAYQNGKGEMEALAMR